MTAMKKHLLFLAFVGTIAVLPLFSMGQVSATPASVKVTGEVTTPLTITDTSLQKYTQVTVVRKGKDGKDYTYKGVLLSDILQKAGATMGPELKGKNLTKYLLIKAADGYQVVFALAELDKAFTDRMIILCNNVDGKPLPAGEGPFRIIVQDEKKPARCIREVTDMVVMTPK